MSFAAPQTPVVEGAPPTTHYSAIKPIARAQLYPPLVIEVSRGTLRCATSGSKNSQCHGSVPTLLSTSGRVGIEPTIQSMHRTKMSGFSSPIV